MVEEDARPGFLRDTGKDIPRGKEIGKNKVMESVHCQFIVSSLRVVR